ncbi:hypothetical protein [Haloferula sp.]|uniref:hypothetical protein n=1 Tax=Haloferula sp. TaxID=2497595 RepID=UPI003C779324
MEVAKSGIREFEKVAAKGWGDGVSLDELLVRVNRVAAKLLPVADERDARISPTLVQRTFRHYVTLGCIDPGQRVGRRAVYGYPQFLQALLVRRLLADGVSAERIAPLVAGKSLEETKRMLLGGVEFVARSEGTKAHDPVTATAAFDTERRWVRTLLAPGLEVHIRDDLPRLKPAELRQVLVKLKAELSRHKY